MQLTISLIHPSRGRAKKAKETLDFWLEQASGRVHIEHVLSCDEDDEQLQEYVKLFSTVLGGCGIAHKNTCVVEATNHAAKIAGGDIIIYLSDDFKCPKNWDLSIIEQIQNDKPQLLKVDDCLQKFDVAVLTIPIMNRKLYETLGYFWFPEYKSMFVDEDLFWTVNNNGWLYLATDLKFPHEHHSIGKCENDITYKMSEANWNQGKELFAKRKMEGFPLCC